MDIMIITTEMIMLNNYGNSNDHDNNNLFFFQLFDMIECEAGGTSSVQCTNETELENYRYVTNL